jgi:simple sugar transport system substrate-binding protein
MRARCLLVGLVLLGLVLAPVAQACEPPRIGVVVHGPADDPFWRLVARGLTEGARASGTMLEIVFAPGGDQPVAAALGRLVAGAGIDALVLSVPSVPAVEAGLTQARAMGIPFITINSGSQHAAALGALLHVGQPEAEAGYRVGQRLARDGLRNALCLIHEPANGALLERCRGLAQGLGGVVRTLELTDPNLGRATRVLADTLTQEPSDAIVSLGPATSEAAIAAHGGARLVLFDLHAGVLDAIAKGDVTFAVDQQPYLQGYLPVLLLRQHLCTGAMPTAEIMTGPVLIAVDDVARLRARVAAGYR